MGTADADKVIRDHRAHIVSPGAFQRSLVRETATYMTPLLCAGVRDVIFVATEPDGDEGAVLGWVHSKEYQSQLYINSLPNRASEADLVPGPGNRFVGNIWATAIETLLHESAHAAVHLLNTRVVEGDCTLGFWSCDKATDAAQWPAAALALARDAMERLRIRASFQTEWNRLHQSFVAVGLARPYGLELAAEEVAGAGFMTAYGGTKPMEDIAEIVAQVLARDITGFTAIDAEVNRGERGDLGCMALAAVTNGVPGGVAALYTKVLLLRDAGLISQEDAAACTGNAGIDTRGTPGVHFFTQTGEYSRTFSDGLTAKIGINDAGTSFKFRLAAEGTLEVRGEEHPATFALILDLGPAEQDLERVSWPRGIYTLDLLGENRLVITVPDEASVTYHVDEGMVLITSATSERIEGSIVMTRAWRPHTTPPVPKAASELPRITFRIDGSR